MRIVLASALAGLAMLAPTLAWAEISTDTVRQKAQQACYDDVNKLCPDAIPDEEKIKVCMKAKHSQLSPKCREIFDANTK
ncbi:MAG: hypothetical protein ACRYGP_19050 [Janthinobacterium lividum]